MEYEAPTASQPPPAGSDIRHRLVSLPRSAKQTLMVVSDAVGLLAAIALCGWLDLMTTTGLGDYFLLFGAIVVVTLLLATMLGFYTSIVRYLGMGLIFAAAKLAAGAGIVLTSFLWFAEMTDKPYQLAVVFTAFSGLYFVGSRYTAQILLIQRSPGRHNVIVFGAGEAGARLAQAMHSSLMNRIVAFIDHDQSLWGKMVAGARVYPSSELERLVDEKSVSRILLALPSASRRERAMIVDRIEKLQIHVQTVPDLNDIVRGRAKIYELHEVGVEDILGRDAVEPDSKLMRSNVTGKAVMVTGAGGSIGSELCRQIVLLRPKLLVLFDISEAALYLIDKELRKLSTKRDLPGEIIAILGTVEDQAHVQEVMLSFGIDTVYHAAAYKHVPVVERNMLAGVNNNVFGTLSTAKAAVEARVDTFVLVSTDKAVSPPNIMGATKRFSELVLQAIQDEHSDTRFCMVRFGNVLESSGSVVPLFREQIHGGGPVTVTHPEIIRYFMTIPEAAQLVIQAGAMAEGGDVFVLDMGQPVKIVDLAERLIRLMGLTVRDSKHPDGDIEIQFTGLRPAEKLYEELLIGDNATGTSHPRIMRANEAYLAWETLEPVLEELAKLSAERDRHGAREVLKCVVDGYSPTNGIDDLVWVRAESEEQRANNVIDLKPAAS